MKKILFFTFLILFTFSQLLAIETSQKARSVLSFELFNETVIHQEGNKEGMFHETNVTLSLLKMNNPKINMANIKDYDEEFKPLTKGEKFNEENKTLWLRVLLDKHFPKGEFVVTYGDMGIVEHSLSVTQNVDMFHVGKTQQLKFTYDPSIDNSVYYFKLSPAPYEHSYRFLAITSKNNFYDELEKGMIVLLSLGVIIGLIFMAGLYNGAMYYYNKDKSFLYYMFMQFGIALVLFNMMGILNFTNSSLARSETYYSLCSLFAIFFTTLFSKTFFDTKIHTPKLNFLLNIYMAMIAIDAFLSIFYVSIIFKYNLLPFMALSYIYIAFKRLKQGFKPALFYLFGWVFLVLALFLDAFLKFEFFVNPLFVGTALEAIFFSFALSYKIKMINDEKAEQKELLVHQSKLASMGEMIANIAHQWRQPLTHLSYTVMNIEDAFKHKSLDDKYLEKKVKEANGQIDFMSQTIDDFKEFYTPHKEKENFSLVEASKQVLVMMHHALEEQDIEVELIILNDLEIKNYKNEYKQVLLNLVSNAKDALVSRVILKPKITLTIDGKTVSVADNAGGIQDELMHKIFEPYFSTKENNSGIGLYMSKMIVERNMGGELSVSNEGEGALFWVRV